MDNFDFHIISEKQADDLERAPHNPPVYSDAFSSDDFSSEWWSVRDALYRRLAILGDEWQLSTGDGDYMLSESRGDSRWVWVTFTSTKLWHPEFVFAVADLLRRLPLDYRVGCVTELNDDEFMDRPLVFLVISSAAVFGYARQGHFDGPGAATWTDSNDELQMFGFPLQGERGSKKLTTDFHALPAIDSPR